MRLHLGYFGAALCFAAASPGCSCGSDTSVGPGTGGSDATSTTATSSGTSQGGGGPSSTVTSSSSSGSGGGQGGAGGSGGAPLVDGKPGTESVSAGQRSSSPGYTMIYTFGQPTQNQGKTTSPGYLMQGGLQGANGSLP